MWKFAFDRKGPESSVISSFCFLRLPWQLAGLTHRAAPSKTARWRAYPLNSPISPWELLPPYHIPPHLLSKITVGPQPGEEIPTMSPLFESCPMFWFSFWPYHAFYGPHFLNYQETEINLNTYSWVHSVNKYQVYPWLRYTHYFRCPRDSMEHTKVLAITEYLLQAGVKNTHMTK